ncbi:hypothetical protein YEY1_07670 [Yersinia enterocolitica subsp. palearctica]|nr:hypothetical protein YEY1_07670 [Yersinia enterocolitica subsp. palearctica]
MVLLWGGVFKHGGQSVFCTDLIRSKSRPKGQDFVSSLKGTLQVPLLISFRGRVRHFYSRLALFCNRLDLQQKQ